MLGRFILASSQMRNAHMKQILNLITALLLAPLTMFAEDGAAKPEGISLWSNHAPIGGGEFQDADATITVHRAAPPNGAAMVICPGGGYGGLVVGAEGHGIAQWLNGHGITGVVLEYRLPRGHAFVPLLDAQRAIRTVRSRAVEWGIDPKRIGIIGFSAGGHLASTAGTHFDAGDPKSADAIGKVSCRPGFHGAGVSRYQHGRSGAPRFAEQPARQGCKGGSGRAVFQ